MSQNQERSNTFRHEIAYRGEAIFEKRKQFELIVCGAGALGSNLLNMLARQGFESLTVIDCDRVERHNLQTQYYGKSDVGTVKVRACKNKLFRDLGVKIVDLKKEIKKPSDLKLAQESKLIVDTFDNFESRRIIQQACREFKISCVHAGMSDDGFSEIKWDEVYRIPEEEVPQEDVCEYPLATNLVHFTVNLLAEVIARFADEGIKQNYEFTLKDLKISSL